MFLFDGLSGQTRRIQLRERRIDCAICSDRPTIHELPDYEAFCGTGACDKASIYVLASLECKVFVSDSKPLHFARLRAHLNHGVC